jgi:two-component system, OmpR family, phosphate regulon sensor histidine kinase PhoR
MTQFEILLLLCFIIAIALYLAERRKKLLRELMIDQLKENQIFTNQLEQQQHELLLDGLTDALLLVNNEGFISYANHAAKNLFADRSLIGLTPLEVFPDTAFMNCINKCEKERISIVEKIILPQQSSPLGIKENRGINAWLFDARPLPEKTYPNARTRILLRDLTQEFQSEQIRQDFVANASHELRTPLAIIQGYLENLSEDDNLANKETTKRFLGIMSKHTDRISRIVEDMLVISRLESREATTLSIEPFSVYSCIQDVCERLEHLIHAQKALIKIYVEPKNLMLNGDRFYWTQILFNLIENALKQNLRSGLMISLEASQIENHIEISVSDDGVGIPSSHLPFIFKRFYRVDQSHTNSSIKGTGLGLSIVKRAIEAHDGVIYVTSIPGKETKFTMEIPQENLSLS